MAQQALPSLNDIAPSWAEIDTTITVHDGSVLETIDYSDLNWSSTLEVGKQRGASGGRVIARTVGEVSHEASATFYKRGLRKLLRALMAKGVVRGNQIAIGAVGFDITVQFMVQGDVEIYESRIKGCRLLGLTNAMTEGPDAAKVELNLNPVEIAEFVDGKEVVLL